MNFIKVTLAGRLGKNPTLKFVLKGSAVCNLSIATNKSWTDKEGKPHQVTAWHNVSIWDKLGEEMADLLVKGDSVYVEGYLKYNNWEDKSKIKRNSVEIVAEKIHPFKPIKRNSEEPEI